MGKLFRLLKLACYNFRIITPPPFGVACLYACLSACEHISKTACPMFTNFVHVTIGPDSILFRRSCDGLSISGFMNGVIFAAHDWRTGHVDRFRCSEWRHCVVVRIGWVVYVLDDDGRRRSRGSGRRSEPAMHHSPGARFTKYLTTILQLSYDNAKVTINLRRTSNLRNILQWMESFS